MTEEMKKDLQTLLAKIVKDVAPKESQTFERFGEHFIDAASRDTSNLSSQGPQFIESMGGISMAAHLVVATVSLIHGYTIAVNVKKEREDRVRVAGRWIDLLVQMGLPRELAENIASRYREDLAQFLIRHTMGLAGEDDGGTIPPKFK
ncbi:MAG TPA: hypothetical protein VE263_06155 [Candidatus Angelobacter sp.]|nr:hypothetical protein [Candidatus Angelobacter sp.]